MRILHCPQNIGGMAGVLAKKQSELGHDAYSYSFVNNIYNFRSDFSLINYFRRSNALRNLPFLLPIYRSSKKYKNQILIIWINFQIKFNLHFEYVHYPN
jgi:hypothetical protein